MAVIVVMVMRIVVVMMVVVARPLHPLRQLLLQRLGIVHKPQSVGDLFPGGIQDLLHPVLALPAVVDEHIRLRQPDHIQRRWLEAVGLPPGRDQQLRLHVLPADSPHKVVVGEQGAHHPQLAALRLCRTGRAARRRDHQCRRQHRRQQPPHDGSSPLHRSHRP